MHRPPDAEPWSLYESMGVGLMPSDLAVAIESVDKVVEEALRSVEGGKATCPSCATYLTSLYAGDGALRTFRAVARLGWSEGVDGITSEEDWLLISWQSDWRWARYEEDVREIRAGVRTGKPGMESDQVLEDAFDRLLAPVSMRGRGGRRRAFEAWMAEREIEPRQPGRGRRPLLATAFGPKADLSACIAQATRWLDHLRQHELDGISPTKHVARVTGADSASPLLTRILSKLKAHPAAFSLFAEEYGQWVHDLHGDLAMAEIATFFPAFVASAATAERVLGGRSLRSWLWHDRRWESHRLAGARRLLATLSGGQFTPRQLRDAERYEVSSLR